MEIDKDLKSNLIADVENVLCMDLEEDTKATLMRCFEVTIGCYNLGASKIEMGKAIEAYTRDDMAELASIAEKERGVIIVCGARPQERPPMELLKDNEPLLFKQRPTIKEPFSPKAKHSPKGHERDYKYHK